MSNRPYATAAHKKAGPIRSVRLFYEQRLAEYTPSSSVFCCIFKKKLIMNWKEFIHTDPQILVGKPVIKGTRLSVVFILGLLANGWSEQQILENYPQLTKESLLAVFAFAQECLQDEAMFQLA